MDAFTITLVAFMCSFFIAAFSYMLLWHDKETNLDNKNKLIKLLQETQNSNWSIFLNELKVVPTNRLSHIIWANCINDKGPDLTKIMQRAGQVNLINKITTVDLLLEKQIILLNQNGICVNEAKKKDFEATALQSLSKLCDVVRYMMSTSGWSSYSINENEVEIINQIKNK